MTDHWHIPAEQLGNYLDDRVDAATAASVEAHLVACPTCREARLWLRHGFKIGA